MDYPRILQGVLDIGESMAKSGAENFRIEDSLYRICKSYEFKRYDVFMLPTNIQMTIETPEGEIITQIRHIDSRSNNYDRLDYLNNLSRYVCQNTPDADELREKYDEVMNRPAQHAATQYLANVLAGAGFTVFFGGDLQDALLAVFISILMVKIGNWLSKRESNLLVYNVFIAFMAETIILLAARAGIAIHTDRIMIGIVMLMVGSLGVINGIRELLQRHFISGLINIMNSLLGAAGIAFGIALSMLLMNSVTSEGYIISHSVLIQLISCTVGCTGFAWMFKIKGRQVLYSSIGSFLTWSIYLVVYAINPSNFVSTLSASLFVGFYAFVMSRVNKAPSTIFLTASVFPLMPGARLYYLMYGYVSHNLEMFNESLNALLETCLAIAFGFLIVDLVSRIAMNILRRDYRISKASIFHRK
ncbi:MAG: threonine/serine exporter ThrE family protein [Dorea sp.]